MSHSSSNYLNDEDPSKRKTRKRDVIKQGFVSAFERLSHSQSQTDGSQILSGFIPAMNNALTMVPAVSHAQKEDLFPVSEQTQTDENPDGALKPRGPTNTNTTGPKRAGHDDKSRLVGVSLPKGKTGGGGHKDEGNKKQGNKEQGNKEQGNKDQGNKDQGNKAQGNKVLGTKQGGKP